jgi:hypothetical protein
MKEGTGLCPECGQKIPLYFLGGLTKKQIDLLYKAVSEYGNNHLKECVDKMLFRLVKKEK